MTVKELREALMGYPPDMDVQLAVNALLHPAKSVDVCIDMDDNSKHCVVYAETKTWEDRMVDVKARLEKLRKKLEVAAN